MEPDETPVADCPAAFAKNLPDYPGRETDRQKCTLQAQTDAAKAVATYCLLPDPRKNDMESLVKRALASFKDSPNHYSTKDCANRHIDSKSDRYNMPRPAPDSTEYKEIIEKARDLAIAGAKLCQVREFEDYSDEPLPYKGYRGIDGKCYAKQVPISK